MGELFRSQQMQLVQLFVQVEAAHDTVDELGKLGLIQFRDLNPGVSAFQRNFVNEVKRSDEMERKIRFFEEQVTREKRDIFKERNLPVDDEESFVALDSVAVDGSVPRPSMDELESLFDQEEKELQQMNKSQEMLNRNYNELVELKYVLMKDSHFFSDVGGELEEAEDLGQQGLLEVPEVSSRAVKLGFVTGVIPRERFPTFERVLWRSTRGNLFMKHAEIEERIKDPQTGELGDKNVFIIFFQGERSQAKIKKICESFSANLYPCADSAKERRDLLVQVDGRLADLQSVIEKSKKHRRGVLLNMSKKLSAWSEQVVKEKAIYHTMNLFNYDVGRKCLIAEGWCPKTATEKIVNAMRQATESSGALVPSILSVISANEEPPTFFKVNKFTRAFQAIVDAYGIAHYREVNPGTFTIITFPFLFAVMFGDFGHGIILAIFAAVLILNEKKLGAKPLNEMIQTCFDGRYVIFLMGIFSIFTGLMYNECFSVALDFFGSNWKYTEVANSTDVFATRIDANRAYPFGVDPAWNLADNMLNYYNSLKMKLSIILGVTHMTTGICLSLLNGLHFRKPLDILFEFVPQLIFIMSIFGYLVFLIFFKWAVDWTGPANPNPNGPPFLLNVLIQMFLSPISVQPENQVYDIGGNTQLIVQGILLGCALIAVPWMLLPKPLILRRQHINKMRSNPSSVVGEEGSEEEFDFSEIFVKQCIHTIEYVLGCISNTASYLRLWALSLAHSELSIVFWERVFITAYAAGEGNVGIQMFTAFCGFGAWAGATFGVLLVMESLSAFLHALRLHWVEFQNKFYHGDGTQFLPFSYERVLAGEAAE